ncbi:10971_t:CDS:2 [Ambispora gerdemannii]|uniref:10971_t:CDS:1 n=1 Tax=Ambispora gerdemannii TaxID=144530 RepID=A0A9N8VRQ4_9GLOM|nr:10971_t:CDS:2 [Ambispora gerdemannii]
MSSTSSKHSAFGANSQKSQDPKSLYCYGCEREKPIHSFSKTQVTKAVSNLHNPYAPGGKTRKKHHTMCKSCTPQQNNTLTCMLCTKTMPLDDFAKAQRRNAEKARCLKCMAKRKKSDEDEDDSAPDTEDDDEDVNYNETWDDIL